MVRSIWQGMAECILKFQASAIVWESQTRVSSLLRKSPVMFLKENVINVIFFLFLSWCHDILLFTKLTCAIPVAITSNHLLLTTHIFCPKDLGKRNKDIFIKPIGINYLYSPIWHTWTTLEKFSEQCT